MHRIPRLHNVFFISNSIDSLDHSETIFASEMFAGICTREGTHEPSQNKYAGLAETQDDREELLCSLVEFAVGLEIKVDIDQVGSGQKLEDHSRRYNGCSAQFHQGSPVRGEHHAQPIEGIRLVTAHDAIERHLTCDQCVRLEASLRLPVPLVLITKNIRRVTKPSSVACASSAAAQDILTASPHQLLIKRNLRLGRRDFGEKWGEWFDQIEEAYYVVG